VPWKNLEDLGTEKTMEKLTGCKVVSSPSNQISMSLRVVIPKHLAVLLAAWAAFPGAWREAGILQTLVILGSTPNHQAAKP